MTSSTHARSKVLLLTILVGIFLSLTSVASAQEFVPLTQLPGLEFTDSSDTLPQFLNQLYRILIGVAAVLAVLMIMRAGAEIMISQGSVMSNEKAKDRIKNAILGLVLVLSPVVVFTVINPDILKLEFDFSNLQPTSKGTISAENNTSEFQARDGALWSTKNSPDKAIDAQRCQESDGTVVYGCKKKDESGSRTVGASGTCNADEDSIMQCKAKSSQPTTLQQCTAKYTEFKSIPMNSKPNTCGTTPGYISVPHGCCDATGAYGNLCCAKSKDAATSATPYLLAYSYTKTHTDPKNVAGNCTNYEPPAYYPTATACKKDMDAATSFVKAGTSNYTYSNLTILKACVATTDTSYKLPDDPKACK